LRSFFCHIHIFAFLLISHGMLCISRGFLPRFWHSLHISSHPMIFIVSCVIVLSFCAFRILEYLLGYFLEIVCMKILFCLFVGFILIYLVIWTAIFVFVILWHPFDSRLKYHIIFLELTGSNGIFGDISDWFWFRNTTSSGSQHSV
jgi:hypothetical protein